jgi:hypothetical protein
MADPCYTASIYPGAAGAIDPRLAEIVRKLESDRGCPVWLLIQRGHGHSSLDHITQELHETFFLARRELRVHQTPPALVIDSGGGDANAAYQISTLFRRHCGGFTAIVPRYAKSAATLLALGADKILLGRDAEVGPLDAQMYDPDTERYGSALDEVQALERLNAAALDQIDQTMYLLLDRTGKKIDKLMPLIMTFTAQTIAPLLDKIDIVHYAERARVLKIAEENATRLLASFHPDAEAVARKLVNAYPAHDFVIGREELDKLLGTESASDDVLDSLMDLEDYLTTQRSTVAIGRIVEKSDRGDRNEPGTSEDAGTDGSPPEPDDGHIPD